MKFELNEYHRNVSDEEFLNDMLSVAKRLNKATISRTEYINNGGKYHWSTIIRRFGSWITALEKCGLTPSTEQTNVFGISSEELLKDLQDVSTKLGKLTFNTTEYKKYGKYSRQIYLRRFGLWNEALKSAGLQPFDHPNKKKISEIECFSEIERMWIELGRQPTTTDINNGVCRYSLGVFERRFGSWRKALENFVQYMNGEIEIEDSDNPESECIIDDPTNKPDVNEGKHKTRRDINLRMRFLVMKRDDFKCCLCGRSPATTPGLELEIDHIFPWSKGGETTFDNLQTLCKDCNKGKSNL